jgi:hypothetical protein
MAAVLVAAVLGEPDIQLFFQAANPEGKIAKAALAKISENWRDGYTSLVIHMTRFFPPTEGPIHPDRPPSAKQG